MSTRVLATDEAKQTITQLQAVLSSSLTETLSKLTTLGDRLAQPDVWDGNLAVQFRNDTWLKTKSSLGATKTALEELHRQLNQIQTDIFAAGGNQ